MDADGVNPAKVLNGISLGILSLFMIEVRGLNVMSGFVIALMLCKFLSSLYRLL